MPDATPNSHQPPEERFLAWVDALVDPAGAIPVPDSDLANLAGTAAFVQRTAGPGSAPSLSPDRTDSMWEEIMHAAPTAATLTPTLPAGTGAKRITPRAIPSAPAPGWRSYATTALLIAAIVAAGIVTAWRIAGPFDLVPGGDGPETAHQPGIAASATPTASADGCPLTSDMLIFVGEAPGGVTDLGMTWLVVEDGDLTVRCAGVDQPEPLTSGVDGVLSLSWPGTVLLAMEDGSAVVFNIATGEQLDIGAADVPLENTGFVRNSPWFLSPANAAHTDWRITNLKTMRSMLLSDQIGGVLKEPIMPSLVWAPDAETAIVSLSDGDFTYVPERNDLPSNDPDADIAELPDGALVVDETLETRRWIDTWGQMAISADGEAIAYQTQIDTQPMVRVEKSLSGDVLAEITDINFNYPSNALFAFAGDGKTLVYLNDGVIRMVSTRTGDTSAVSLAGFEMPDGTRPVGVYPTGVAGRVLIELGTEGSALMNAANPVAILDTASGELTSVDGAALKYGFAFDPVSRDFAYIVTTKPTDDSPLRTILELVDIRTGKVVIASDPLDGSIETLTKRGMAATAVQSGETVVVSLAGEWALLFDLASQSASPILMEGLDNLGLPDADMFWTITPSSDGQFLYAWGIHLPPELEGAPGRQYLAISTRSGEATWTLISDDLVPEGGSPSIAIVPAVSSEVRGSDEPAVLEAQEFPSPAASPTSPVAVTGCDLTGDIPVVTDLDAAPSDGTALLLQDGTLSLTCDSGTTVVVEGVTEVVPLTTWPGAVLLHMDDGSLRGVNLLTGAEGDLGAFPTDFIGAGPLVTRWVFFPTSPEQLDWRIIDLETMDSLLLSEEIGGVLPRSTVAHLWATTPDAAVIGFGGTPIIPGQVPSGPFDRGGATPPPGTPTAELPAEWSALVFDGSLDNRRLIETSRSMQTTAAISPDGELLAYSRPAGDGFTVRVERLSDGGLVADTGIELGGPDAFLLLDTGVLHLTPDRLDRVTWDDAGAVAVDTLITFEAPPDVPVLVQTTGPNVAIVGATGPSGESVGYLVDAASGEVTEVPGMLQMPFYLAQYNDGAPVGYVLAAAPTSDPDQSAVQLIEIATGEPVATSEPLDVASQELATSPAALRGDRGFVFLPDGRIVVVDAERGEASMIEPPGDLKPSYLMPSPGGDALAVAAGKLFVRAVEPGAQWIEVTVDTFITFVPGAGALFDVP